MTRRRRCQPDFPVSTGSGEVRRSVKKEKKIIILEPFFSFSNSSTNRPRVIKTIRKDSVDETWMMGFFFFAVDERAVDESG